MDVDIIIPVTRPELLDRLLASLAAGSVQPALVSLVSNEIVELSGSFNAESK